MDVNLELIRQAHQLIRGSVHRTPIFSSRYLGCYLKAEMFQKTGSFKPRGVINRIKHFSDEEKSHGIVTVSAGNHAQAAAYAAAIEAVPAVVVMPSSAPQNKLDATRGYGATVILHDDMKTIFERTEEERAKRGATFLHPFDDAYVIAGHGTAGLEIYEDLPDVETVLVGIGGGGLISGIALALKSLNQQIRVIGVEPQGAAGMKRALAEGKPVRLEKIETIADGLAAPYVGKLNLEITQQYVDDVVLVTDDEIISALKILLERTKLVTEPAGAATVAAWLAGKVRNSGKTVAMLSGGNVNLDRLKNWL